MTKTEFESFKMTTDREITHLKIELSKVIQQNKDLKTELERRFNDGLFLSKALESTSLDVEKLKQKEYLLKTAVRNLLDL